MTASKILSAAAGALGGAGLNIPEVFSTTYYEGNGVAGRTITNGIDLSGEGGLVWTKSVNLTYSNTLIDTENGGDLYLYSNDDRAHTDPTSAYISQFNSNGYVVGQSGGGVASELNANNSNKISWCWRKAENFFDIVTYTGDGNNGRAIAHNLNSTPGFIIVKRTDVATDWTCYHRGILGSTTTNAWQYTITLNGNNARYHAEGAQSASWSQNPTSTHFYVDDFLTRLNESGAEYVAYLFAHHDGDGTFGPDGDADIIKCGSYTGNGQNAQNHVNLGFEPQFLMIRRTDQAQDWHVYDNFRGLRAYDWATAAQLYWNRTYEENNQLGGPYAQVYITPTGFSTYGSSTMWNVNGGNYIYMAIRAGDLTPPEHGDEAYATDTWGGGPPAYYSGFAPDMIIEKDTSTGIAWTTSARFMSTKKLQLQESGAAGNISSGKFIWPNGYYDSSASLTQYRAWMWQNRPKYFRCYGYEGNGSTSRTFTHDLGAVPKMIWVKSKASAERNGDGWQIYHYGADDTAPENYYMTTDDNGARNSDNAIWAQTQPTDTEWYTGTNHAVINGNGDSYFVALFAELAGVTKIGSYTMQSGGTDVDCGFSNGPRFVLIKSRDGGRDWMVFDTQRGIVAGNDPYLRIGENSGNVTSQDVIDPLSSGFHIPQSGNGSIANVGETYMFYAIAAQ